jgi:hypothetical protein
MQAIIDLLVGETRRSLEILLGALKGLALNESLA